MGEVAYNQDYAEELEELKDKNKVVPIRDPDVARYFDGKVFIPRKLAEEIAQENPVFHDGNFLYMYEDGVYKTNAQQKIQQIAQEKLKDEARRNRIEETLYYLRSYRLVQPRDLNSDKSLINVKNGLYNWQDNVLHAHTPQYLSTIQLNVSYDPNAESPAFNNFIYSILSDDAIPMAIEIIGYSMVLDTRLKKAVMLTGVGNNGKSVLIYAIEELLGASNISNIELQRLEADKFAKAQLYGKLANTFSDLSARIMESSNALKTITSGDVISGEFKGRDSFSFTPAATLIFSANEIPTSKELDPAFFDRWVILDLPRSFKPHEQNKNLKYEITTEEEKSGIFNQAIEGLKRVVENGQLTPSESSYRRKEQYQREADNVLLFVDEECVIHHNAMYPKDKLYEAYKRFCLDNGYRSLGKIKYNRRLKNKFPELKDNKRPTGSSVLYWEGIGLKAEQIADDGKGDLQI